MYFFFFKQKTAYELRISDWSSDVCSSDLALRLVEADDVLGEDPVHEERLATGLGVDPHHRVLDSREPRRELLDQLGGHRHAEALAPVVHGDHSVYALLQIGRASCRERVCQYV